MQDMLEGLKENNVDSRPYSPLMWHKGRVHSGTLMDVLIKNAARSLSLYQTLCAMAQVPICSPPSSARSSAYEEIQ